MGYYLAPTWVFQPKLHGIEGSHSQLIGGEALMTVDVGLHKTCGPFLAPLQQGPFNKLRRDLHFL